MSDKATDVSPLNGEISRRDLLAKAGKVGAGALAAGSLAGPAGAVNEPGFRCEISLCFVQVSSPFNSGPQGHVASSGGCFRQILHRDMAQ